MVIKIDSLFNEKIKLAKKISQSSKARRENLMFFLEGRRLCRDAVLTGIDVEWFFFTKAAFEKNQTEAETIISKAKCSFEISDSVATKLSETQNSQNFFCVCNFPKEKGEDQINPSGKYIALENIQDPANLGAICRTAEALGIDGAIIENCCDIYNSKAQRAAMGSLLRLPVISTNDLQGLLVSCGEKSMKLYCTMPDSKCEKITTVSMSGGVIAVIGNEGNGVSERVSSVCEKITIPMLGRAESLNASMAAAITMWEMMRNE